MSPFNPAPKFIFLVIVARLRLFSPGGIEVIEEADQPCGIGRVLKSNSDKFPDLKEGDLVFFRKENLTLLRLEAGIMHGSLYEDAVLGSMEKGAAEAIERHVGKLNAPALQVPKQSVRVN